MTRELTEEDQLSKKITKPKPKLNLKLEAGFLQMLRLFRLFELEISADVCSDKKLSCLWSQA